MEDDERQMKAQQAGARLAESLNLSPSTRKLIVNGVLVAIALVAIAAVVSLLGGRGREDSTDSAEAGPATAGTYIRAGGWICNSHYAAAGNARLQSVNSIVGFEGCSQVGTDIRVNVLNRTVVNGYEVVQVGNAGGVAWVWSEHLN